MHVSPLHIILYRYAMSTGQVMILVEVAPRKKTLYKILVLVHLLLKIARDLQTQTHVMHCKSNCSSADAPSFFSQSVKSVVLLLQESNQLHL